MTSTTDTEKQPLLGQNTETEPEPSLAELQQNVRQAQRAYFRVWSRTTSGKWHKRIMFCVTGFLTFIMLFCFGVILVDYIERGDEKWHIPTKVPLEAHIMSKCPDARDCLHDMILPAMQNVSGKVDFKLSYIGNITSDDDGVLCKHGESECLGNMIELCAAHAYPNPRIHLGFVMCLTKDYSDIPSKDLVEDCALEHGIAMTELSDCVDFDRGALGLELLRASFNRSREAGVTKSCTVRLNDEVRCIRDDGEWKDCDGGYRAQDLVEDILNQYTGRWMD